MCTPKIFFLIGLIVNFLISGYNFLECATKGSAGWIIFRKAQSPKPRPLTAVCAVRGDLSGVLYNPSILATVERKEIFAMGELGLTGNRVGGIIYAHPFYKSAISIGAVSHDAGKMTLYWLEGGVERKRIDITAQSDLLAFVSYGRKFANKLNLGLTAKFATSNIAETASANAFAIDLGALYFLTDKLTFSFGGQNLGVTTKFLNKAERLPMSVWIGAGYSGTFGKDFYFVVGGDVPYILNEARIIPSIGLEIGRTPIGLFAGYRFNVEEGLLNIGFNITLKMVDVSYAFVPTRWLNPIHRIALGIRF